MIGVYIEAILRHLYHWFFLTGLTYLYAGRRHHVDSKEGVGFIGPLFPAIAGFIGGLLGGVFLRLAAQARLCLIARKRLLSAVCCSLAHGVIATSSNLWSLRR